MTARLILSLRFGQELNQSEIGDRLGLSQMHVSRLLSRIMARLRAGMLGEGEGDSDGVGDPVGAAGPDRARRAPTRMPWRYGRPGRAQTP